MNNTNKIKYLNNFLELEKFLNSYSKLYSNILIFTQRNILEKTNLKSSINFGQLGIKVFLLDNSEKAKSIFTFDEAIDYLVKNKFGRDSLIIGLGGGIVTDLSGFVASCYMRGIHHIFIPTSLLGIVDASIGGKTAINYLDKRNIIGTFKQAEQVLVIPEFLKFLNKKEIINGFAEILKYGLILDKKLFDFIELHFMNLINNANSKDMLKIIKTCINLKVNIVDQDFRDDSIRNILNFGHTIGHAIEINSNYHISHGEAVFYGMKAASYISMKDNHLSLKEYNRIIKFLKIIPIDWNISFDCNKIYNSMQHDKKIKQNKISFILLDKIGKAYMNNKVPASLVKESIDSILI